MVRDEQGLVYGSWVLASIFLIFPGRYVPAESGPRRLLLEPRPNASAVETLVSAAVRKAQEKLASAQCRLVFTDFHDGRGQTLADNLERRGQSAASYLPLVLFYDGYGEPRCDVRTTMASTTPGSRAVFICSPQFLATQRRQPGLAAVLIIHEELHSLGLGEDPPTSKQITSAVIARCGL